MAKVSLRIYNREIETMVDRGQLDEAISHCRHILNTFPKNIETYRLLGKAYLEARRYDEATDVFERVLMAVPDDFVAHVGMSIIDDEQNELDAAIWHMERAFEVQPANAAIQAELQRLFGRRDGVEPPKVRLTRGALAHMYVQGELYPQAISEIKAVLEDDRERQDMQVLLARAYFHAGQKNEAAEVCSQLLRRYPYCLDANRVLVELLPETERGESPQAYRNRVNELDPYATFATGSVFHTEDVPDAAVSLERLDWDGQPVDLGQEWSDSRGIGLAGQTATEMEPDWLKSGLTPGSFSASMPTEEPAVVSSGDDDIPDFLREAGWGKDTGVFKEGPGTFESSDESLEEPALAEGDLPDWIKAMAPTGAGLEAPTPRDEMEEDLTQDDVPDWLQGLGDAHEPSPEGAPLEEGDLPDWLAAMKPVDEMPQEQPDETVMAEPAGEEDIPDWLAAMKPSDATPQETQPDETVASEPGGEEEISDWLAAMKESEALPQELQAEEEQMAEPTGGEDIPAWMAGLEPAETGFQESPPDETVIAEPSGEDEIPDWLTAMQAEEDTTQQETHPEETGIAEPTSDEDLPDWIRAMKTEDMAPQEPQPDETVVTEPTGEEELPDWIAALKPAEEPSQEPHPEETVLSEPAGDEALPDWLRGIQAEEDKFATGEMTSEAPQEPVQEFPEVTSESLSDWQIGEAGTAGAVDFDATDTGALGTSAAEQDDAIAWLEGLAAKHGAKPEELVTRPEERSEAEPEWIQQAKAFKEQETVETPVPQEEVPAEPSPELPDFLAEIQVEPTEAPSGDVAPVDAGTVGPSAAEQDDAIAWLESLAAKHGAKPEELVTDPNARKETAPEWVQKAAETGSVAQPPAEEAPVEETAENIPEWIEPAKEEAGSLYPELEDTQPHKAVSRTEKDETGIWLRDMEEEIGAAGEQEPAAEAEAAAMSMSEDLPDWLREVEVEPSEAEAGPPPAEEAQEAPVWLGEMEAEPSQAETGPISREEAPEAPDWLLGVESDQTATERSPVFSAEEEMTLEAGPETIGKIDLNTASVEELAELPGIGDFLAENIVAYREIYGPFASVDDLNNIVGIDPATIDELRGRVEFHEGEAAVQPAEAEITDWWNSVEEEAEGELAEEVPAEETVSGDLPSWLAGLEEEQPGPEPAVSADDELPEWLRAVEEQEAAQAEPTAPTDWQPAEIPSAFEEEPSVPVAEPDAEGEEPPVQAAPPPAVSEPEPEPQREPYVEPVTRSRSGMTGMLSTAQDPILSGAQLELTRGNVSTALASYEKLIRRGKMLDEIIFDLREALYRYPVDVSIHQALGDAYMRANRLQDALDAYTKAEELLR